MTDTATAALDPTRRFPRQARLLSARDFEPVFAGGTRYADKSFTVLVRPSPSAGARLGLAISRKAAADARERNRIKRQIRESFRLRRASLPAVDIVVLGKPGIAKVDNAQLRAALTRLLNRIVDACAPSSSP